MQHSSNSIDQIHKSVAIYFLFMIPEIYNYPGITPPFAMGYAVCEYWFKIKMRVRVMQPDYKKNEL